MMRSLLFLGLGAATADPIHWGGQKPHWEVNEPTFMPELEDVDCSVFVGKASLAESMNKPVCAKEERDYQLGMRWKCMEAGNPAKPSCPADWVLRNAHYANRELDFPTCFCDIYYNEENKGKSGKELCAGLGGETCELEMENRLCLQVTRVEGWLDGFSGTAAAAAAGSGTPSESARRSLSWERFGESSTAPMRRLCYAMQDYDVSKGDAMSYFGCRANHEPCINVYCQPWPACRTSTTTTSTTTSTTTTSTTSTTSTRPMECVCKTPGTGPDDVGSPKNEFECYNDNDELIVGLTGTECAANELCFASVKTPGFPDSTAELCKVPDTCTCDNENGGLVQNDFTCTDGTTGDCGSFGCTSPTPAYMPDHVTEMCKHTCVCDTPNTGDDPSNNAYTCTSGITGNCVDTLGNPEECVATNAVPLIVTGDGAMEPIDDLCDPVPPP